MTEETPAAPPPPTAAVPSGQPRLGIRAYARWRSARYGEVSHAAVRKAIESGRVAAAVGPDGKIDPVLADQLWDDNTDPAQRRRTGPRPDPDAKQPKLFAGGDANGAAPVSEEKDDGAFNYRRASTLREIFRAKNTELDYRVRKGELVNAAAVKRAQFEMARRVRDGLRRLRENCSARLVGAKTEAEVQLVLDREIDELTDELRGGAP